MNGEIEIGMKGIIKFHYNEICMNIGETSNIYNGYKQIIKDFKKILIKLKEGNDNFNNINGQCYNCINNKFKKK